MDLLSNCGFVTLDVYGSLARIMNIFLCTSGYCLLTALRLCGGIGCVCVEFGYISGGCGSVTRKMCC